MTRQEFEEQLLPAIQTFLKHELDVETIELGEICFDYGWALCETEYSMYDPPRKMSKLHITHCSGFEAEFMIKRRGNVSDEDILNYFLKRLKVD